VPELGAPLPAALPLLSEVSPELADESCAAISSSPSAFMGCKAGLHRMPVLCTYMTAAATAPPQ